MAFSRLTRISVLQFSCALTLLSGYVNAADLLTAYQSALVNDPIFAQAKAKKDSIQEKYYQGRAGLLPNISFTGNLNSFHENVENQKTATTSDRSYNGYDYKLTLTQPIFRWQNWVGFEQSKLQVAQAEVAFLNAKQDLILRTSQAYFEQLLVQEKLVAAKSYKNAVESQLDIARKAFAAGIGVKTDIYDAETRFQLANAQVMTAQTELELRQKALANITGQFFINLGVKKFDSISLGVLDEVKEFGTYQNYAEVGNFNVQEQQIALEIANSEVGKQRSGHYPTVDLIAATGNSSLLNLGARETNNLNRIGLQLNIPIFQGGEVNSKIAEAVANSYYSKSSLDLAKNTAQFDLKQAYLGLINGGAQIKILQTALRAANDSQQSNKDAFDLGLRLNIDVLNAQNQVFNTKLELIRVTTETLLAYLKLKAVSGMLAEADVSNVDHLLAY